MEVKHIKNTAIICTGIALMVGVPKNVFAENNFEKIEINQENTQSQIIRTIADGIYQIKSALNENYVLDVENSSSENWVNIQIMQNKKTKNQKFQVTYIGDGYYQIIALHSGKSIDVKDAKIANCTNVQQCQYTGNNAQKWWIRDAGDGYYNIISKLDNNKALDVYMAKVGNGVNIQTCDLVNNQAQKFKFEEVKEEKPTQTIANGTYQIKSALNENYVLDVENSSSENWINIQIMQNKKTKNQKFQVTYIGDGYYQIIALHSGKSIDVKDAKIANCTNVQQCQYTGHNAQKWWIRDAGDGYYNIVSKLDNNKALDVCMAKVGNGVNIQTCDLVNNQAQKFKFEEVKEEKPTQTIANGTYQIKSALNENYVLDVENSSSENWANIQIMQNRETQNQKFQVTYIGDGYYQIIALHSGKSIDVKDAKIANCTNVQQCQYTGHNAQKWWIRDAGDGYYNIISKLDNNKALDVYMARVGNGVNIQTCDLVNNQAQKFKFVRTKEINEGTYKIQPISNLNLTLDYDGQGNTVAETEKSILSQMFDIKYIDDKYCRIISTLNNNKVLTDNNGKVCILENENSDFQLWIPEYKGNGYYSFKSKSSGNYLTYKPNSIFEVEEYSNTDSHMFYLYDITEGKQGTYGTSGLKHQDNNKGSYLNYYKYGTGENVLFATFELHGFEDGWNYDGTELALIANDLYNSLINNKDLYIAKNWTVYIFPNVNPDGVTNGWTNNGPGRTSLYSLAPNNRGIDINRCWQSSGESYKIYTDSRNYNGTAGFQAYEAIALRDFLVSKKSTNGKTLLIDLHGWENSLIGDYEICNNYFEPLFPSATKKYDKYGTQYLISWARAELGAQAALVELPDGITSHEQSVKAGLSNKYVTAVTNMLKNVTISNKKIAAYMSTKNTYNANVDTAEEAYYIELAGLIKNDVPTQEDVENAKKMDINNKQGFWIPENSREEIINKINEITNNFYIVNDDGFVTLAEEINEKNKYDEFVSDLINSQKLYIFSISGNLYLRDKVSKKIIDNEYQFFDADQTYDYVKLEDKMIIDIPKNSKIDDYEIFDSLIELINLIK